MTVAPVARNDVPVQVRNLVAEAGKIDLVRVKQLPHRGFAREHDSHQPLALFRVKFGHLTRMLIEDDAAEPRIVVRMNTHNAAKIVAPQYLTSVVLAKLAPHGFQDSLQQHALDAACVCLGDELRQPILPKQAPCHFDHNIVGLRPGVIREPR